MTSLANQIADAENAVAELQEALDGAVSAIENLEGSLDDANCLDNLDLTWQHGEPNVYEMLSNLKLVAASFSHTEELM
jgi:hypothetical protein